MAAAVLTLLKEGDPAPASMAGKLISPWSLAVLHRRFDRHNRLFAFALLVSLLVGFLPAGERPANGHPAGRLSWAACSDAALAGYECATLAVPRSYRNPA